LTAAVKYQISYLNKLALAQQVNHIKHDGAEAHNNMGNVQKDKGDQDAAIESYKYALKIKPKYADSYSNMGNCLLGTGKLEEGRSLIQKN